MNVILCMGVMRSASTWSFNVCRAIAATAAGHLDVPWDSFYSESDPMDRFFDEKWITREPGVSVIKTHMPSMRGIHYANDGYLKTICTLRDPMDCVASRQQFKEEEFPLSVEMVKGSFLGPMRMNDKTMFIDYPDIIDNPENVIVRILDYLAIQTPDNREFANLVQEQFSMEKMAEKSSHISGHDSYDVDTQLHANHVNGGIQGRWKDELSEIQQLFVQRELANEIAWYQAKSKPGECNERKQMAY